MKVLKILPISEELIETDDGDFPIYIRWAHDNWENIMGESTEPVYSYCEELEKAYQQYKKESK